MISFLVGLAVLTFLLWLAFHITGAFLSAAVWLLIKIPLALVVTVLGIVCCCTIILIPVGIALCKAGFRLFVPGI